MRFEKRSPSRSRFFAAIGLLAAGGVVGFFTGCGGYAAAICAASCKCNDCTDTARESCEKTISDSEKEAHDVGCSSEASTFEGCTLDRGSCIGTLYVIGGCDIERKELTATLAELYRTAPDGGTHAAAGWTLRQWKAPLPDLPSGPTPTPGRDWFVNQCGLTMVRIRPGSGRKTWIVSTTSGSSSRKISAPSYITAMWSASPCAADSRNHLAASS